MYATLSEIRESSVAVPSGKCANSTEFTAIVNEACQRLMRRGDWANLVVPIQVCALNSCVVFPRYVGQVRKVNLCNQPTTMRNPWYNFLTYDNPRFYEGWGNGWATSSTYSAIYANAPWLSWLGAQAYITGGVETPVFQGIMGDGRFLRFYPSVQADVGKIVTVFGVDNNDQELRHKLADGSWEPGWIVTLASPFGSTTDYVRRIDRLVFEDHESTVRAYAYNAASDVLEDVGIYEGHYNNPAFVRYNLTPNGQCGGGSCGCVKSIVALVKLRFIPARFDTDLVLISNLEALELMVQSIQLRRAGDIATARAFEQDAIRSLNLDLRDAYPDDQTPVGNGVLGGTGCGVQRCF